jgi:hypothetical protein
MKPVLFVLFLLSASLAIAAPSGGWKPADWLIKDEISEVERGSLDLCNVFLRDEGGQIQLKITTRSPIDRNTGFHISLLDSRGGLLSLDSSIPDPKARWNVYRGVAEIELTKPESWQGLSEVSVSLIDLPSRKAADEGNVRMDSRESLDNDQGNCAFVHHGNQGLTYTDVFRGTGSANGFDEILALHDTLNIPGNFHLSGTLITAAEWYDRGFSDWMRRGITEGWVAMLTSAYAQHIMPFVTNNMNDWSVQIEHDLIQTKFNYNAQVAWVPERVWLSQGHYPDGGINDSWLGDNWTQHGVNAVILDDWPHLSGADNHKIHWMNNGAGITLRVIPIDNSFTGNVHNNPGAAISTISSTGRYGIAVYGTDWEAASEMADFNCPNCLENYSQILYWCHDNYPAVGVWKLDAAINNPDFNGSGVDLTNGTYGLIGGTDGYGGSNNSWYNDWAGTASHSDGHNPVWNYGTVWTQTYNHLMAAPDNNISQSGWYVMMTNLHETAWHDYMGGPISGWEHRYSSHIKNANVYAEAAHWAAGEYAVPVNAFHADIDWDGVDELVIHNERVFAVFESTGGRAPWIFARGPNGYNYSVVGSDNTYWNETDGDFDEPNSNNHQAAFADVSPNFRNNLYSLAIDGVTDTTAQIRLSYGGITKTIAVSTGQPCLDVRYDVGYQTCYLRHGYTPDLIDLIWNADMQRIWAPDVAYCGYRDPHTGATAACILGNGGAAQNLEFSGTLVRGDEMHGYDRFGFLFYAGSSSAPDSQGRVAELEALKTQNLDHFSPRMNTQAVFINAGTVEVSFSEAVDQTSANTPANWSLQGFVGSYSVTAAARQADWTRVRLTISPNLASGDHGYVAAAAVTDMNGNVVLSDADTATLTVPTGLTPHTIVIDGVRDFDLQNEILFAGTDTLVLTWDSLALYVAYWNRDLASANFLVNIDINQQTAVGAQTSSRGTVRFADPYRIEYQLYIDGGPNNIELNRWSGTAWQIRSYGQHSCSSYNGWSGNLTTEVRIPWSDLGNPVGIALSVHVLSQTNSSVLRVFPTTNIIGSPTTIAQVYRIFPPYISGNLPLYGARPKYILTADLATPSDLVISESGPVHRLTWSPITGAASYAIYRSSTLGGTYTLIGTSLLSQFDDSEAVSGATYFYQVKAVSGI